MSDPYYSLLTPSANDGSHEPCRQKGLAWSAPSELFCWKALALISSLGCIILSTQLARCSATDLGTYEAGFTTDMRETSQSLVAMYI